MATDVAVASTGPQGSQGFAGTQGTQGAIGYQGPQVRGAQGPQAERGAQGAQGPQGFQGTQGFIGPQGAQGIQGNYLSTGFQGIQGLQGIQGPFHPNEIMGSCFGSPANVWHMSGSGLQAADLFQTYGSGPRAYPHLGFPGGVDSTNAFFAVVPRDITYATITARIIWWTDSTSGNVKWTATIQRLANGDLLSSGVQTNTTTVATASAWNIHETDLTISNDDSIANGDLFYFRLSRNGTDVADTFSGSVYLFTVKLIYS